MSSFVSMTSPARLSFTLRRFKVPKYYCKKIDVHVEQTLSSFYCPRLKPGISTEFPPFPTYLSHYLNKNKVKKFEERKHREKEKFNVEEVFVFLTKLHRVFEIV